jgi:hypothetical protein
MLASSAETIAGGTVDFSPALKVGRNHAVEVSVLRW